MLQTDRQAFIDAMDMASSPKTARLVAEIDRVDFSVRLRTGGSRHSWRAV